MAGAFTVAIDGPAAAGKGTIARAVAAEFGFAHLDTGLLYRAVGAQVLAGAEPVAAARTWTLPRWRMRTCGHRRWPRRRAGWR